jgi:hypothetical protein
MISLNNQLPSNISRTIRKLDTGIKAGVRPTLTNDGTSGTYLMRGVESGKPLAVFKPIDEE